MSILPLLAESCEKFLGIRANFSRGLIPLLLVYELTLDIKQIARVFSGRISKTSSPFWRTDDDLGSLGLEI